jgi:hypothetical protein
LQPEGAARIRFDHVCSWAPMVPGLTIGSPLATI